jgi:peptidoglycan/xylan/chitin deacetylase (PgdA/CDA1 family)
VKRPAKKFKSRLEPLRQSRFAHGVMFAIVIVGLLGYMMFYFRDITAVLGVSTNQPATVTCSFDTQLEDTHPNTQELPLSPVYQNYIKQQPSITGNLVANATLERVTEDTPEGYYRTVIADWADYSVGRENNEPFLRIVTAKDIPADAPAAGWIMQEIAIKPDGTYVYSFEYRSSAPVTVNIEYIMPDGTTVYEQATTLPVQNSWQSFTAYAQNTRGAQKLRFTVTSKKAAQVDTRRYDVHGIADARLKQGMVTIAFDDGWQSIYDKALPILRTKDIRTTQFVISEAAEKDIPGYMRQADIAEFKAAGHEVASHTEKHCDQTKLSPEEGAADAKDSKTALERLRLGPISAYAYPYGQHNEATRQVVGKHYPLIRSSDAGYNDRYFDRQNIHAMGVLSTTTDKEFRSWLDYAKQQKVWVVIVYHRVDETGEYSVTSEQLARHLDMIRESKLPVLPLTEAASSIR